LPNNVKALAVARVLSFLSVMLSAIQSQRMTLSAAKIAAHLQRGLFV
jgi:hypothetical protein